MTVALRWCSIIVVAYTHECRNYSIRKCLQSAWCVPCQHSHMLSRAMELENVVDTYRLMRSVQVGKPVEVVGHWQNAW